jgi:hypothetical protein
VEPAYAARFQDVKGGETEEMYVQRLKEDLDKKFRELGGETVAACES